MNKTSDGTKPNTPESALCTSNTPVCTTIPQIFVGSFFAKILMSDSIESQKRRIPINRVEFQAIFFNEIKIPRSINTGAKTNRFHSQKSVSRNQFR
jgi:hypothetical protein